MRLEAPIEWSRQEGRLPLLGVQQVEDRHHIAVDDRVVRGLVPDDSRSDRAGADSPAARKDV